MKSMSNLHNPIQVQTINRSRTPSHEILKPTTTQTTEAISTPTHTNTPQNQLEHTTEKEMRSIRQNDIIIPADHPNPILILSINTFRQGAHGFYKARYTAIDIFTHEKTDLRNGIPLGRKVTVPQFERRTGRLLVMQQERERFLCSVEIEGSEQRRVYLPDSEIGRDMWRDFEQGVVMDVDVVECREQEVIVGYHIVE
eukprot:TRINITY_DN13656_c0_g1_i1.p1 TRINITY_DN13656_c0_g1~~TRINITY_DN13656_c0_g1_i1.p1  ORF type:complete len:209 (-),score=27.30 TRINITY_DN13656_c0_g1_i1:26-619(-)